MSKRTHRSIVTVLSGGLGLSLAACSGKETVPPPGNPPPPVTDGAGADGSAAGKEAPPDPNAQPGPAGEKGPHSGREAGDKLPVPTANPPPPDRSEDGPLPTWDQVESGHPEGATNPPRPVLVVMEAGPRCWKEWVGGMLPPTEEVLQLGGRVITDAAETKGTEIACPRRQAQSILDKAAARKDVPPQDPTRK